MLSEKNHPVLPAQLPNGFKENIRMKVKLNYAKSQEAPYASYSILQRFFKQLRGTERCLRNLLLQRFIAQQQRSTGPQASELVDCCSTILEAKGDK